MSGSSFCTAQCSAVAPSGAAWLTFAVPLSSVRTLSRSPALAASTSEAGPADNPTAAAKISAAPVPTRCLFITNSRPVNRPQTQPPRSRRSLNPFAGTLRVPCGDPLSWLQACEMPGAVGNLLDRDAQLVEERHAEVHERRVQLVFQVPPALELPAAVTADDDRHVDRGVVIAVA